MSDAMMIENLNAPSRSEWQTSPLKAVGNWALGFGLAALLIVAALYAFYLYQRPAAVDDVKPAVAVVTPSAPVVMPTPAKRFPAKPVPKPEPKNATDSIANYTINTPAKGDIKTKMKAEIEPETLTPAEQDFANRLANFERKLP